MKKHLAVRCMAIALSGLLILGVPHRPAPAGRGGGRVSLAPPAALAAKGGPLWSDSLPASGEAETASDSAGDASVASSESAGPGESAASSEPSSAPLRAGPATMAVSGVAAGGLAAAVAAANDGSADFSALRELRVSGVLNAADFNFLKTLSGLQTLDLAGCSVTAMNVIPGALFANQTSLTRVTLPGLGSYLAPNNLFMGCTSLVFADVSHISGFGTSVFSGCISLQSVTMPFSYTIETAMFKNCTSLTTFNASKSYIIRAGAFSGCTALTSVNLSGTAKTVQDSAFYGCSALKSISLPAGSKLESYAFAGCAGLVEVDLRGVQLTGTGVFQNCTALQSFTPTADGVLAPYTFSGCTALTAVDLSSFKTFGEGAFSGCSALRAVTLPAGCTLAAAMFRSCTSLAFVDLSATAALGRGAFWGCVALAEVRMPAAPYAIPPETFFGCAALERIDLSAALSVGASAFHSCRHLYDITWPSPGFADAVLGNAAFALNAQDFSTSYPAGSGFTDANVARVAHSQQPRVYFLLPNGESGSVPQGGVFLAPYRLQTQHGTEYAAMCLDPAFDPWRAAGLAPPDVTPHVSQDGQPLPGVDTNVPGVYDIRYTLPDETFSNTHSLQYTITVVPGGPASSQDSAPPPASAASSSASTAPPAPPPGFDGTPASPVAVGEEFTLTPAVEEKLRQDGWCWDRTYVEGRIVDGRGRFCAQREGETCVTYTLRSGYLIQVNIIIVERPCCWLWLLVPLLAGGVLACCLWQRRKRQKSKPARKTE